MIVTMEHDTTAKILYFVYDGECPICSMGAGLYRLKQSVGVLRTIDARKEHDHPLMQQIKEAGLDLDQAMVVAYDGALYHGDAALHLMAVLGDDANWFNHMNVMLYRSKVRAKLGYPVMKLARNIALKLKGVKGINEKQRS